MEFVLGFGIDIASHTRELSDWVYHKKEPVTFRRIGEFECAYTGASFEDKDELFLFGGHCARGGDYFHQLSKPPTPADVQGLAKTVIYERDGTLTGLYWAVHVTKMSAHVATDYLNQIPIFRFQAGRRWVVSNSHYLLTQIMSANGLRVTANIMPAVQNLAYGTVFDNSSPTIGVDTLPHGYGLRADPELNIVRRPAPDTKGITYEECIREAHSSISGLIGAIGNARADWHITVDVTGGADSRCTLGFLLDSDLRYSLGARCLTRTPHPDAVVALNIIERYAIGRAIHPIVVLGRDGLSDELAVRMNAVVSGGAKDAGAPVPSLSFPNFLHFRGSFGEIGGATPGRDYVAESMLDGLFSAERMADAWLLQRGKAGALDLLTGNGKRLARQSLVDTVTSLLDLGIRPDQLQSELYLRSRSRTHFGINHSTENLYKCCPDPLANQWLVEARRRIPKSLHSQNKVIFDLSYMSDPDLAMQPLAGKSWNSRILPPGLEPAPKVTVDVAAEKGEAIYTAHRFQREVPRRATAFTTGGSKGDLSRFALAGSTAGFQSALRTLLDAVDSQSDVWHLLDRDAIQRYSKREPEDFSTSGIDTNAMGIAASGLAHIAGIGIAPQIDEQTLLNFGT